MGPIRRFALAAQAATEHLAGRRAPARTELSAGEILQRLLDLEISTWNYDFEPSSVRRIGPMAQEFFAAFGFGPGETTIPLESAVGVLMVCVQELARERRPARRPTRPRARTGLARARDLSTPSRRPRTAQRPYPPGPDRHVEFGSSRPPTIATQKGRNRT